MIPILLYDGGGLVKTKRFRNPQYVGDPMNAVRIFNEKEVDELIILDIGATLQKRGPDEQMIADVASECFMPIGFGGGVNSVVQMQRIFRLGVEKVCLNTSATESRGLVREASSRFGSQSVMVSIDAKQNWRGRYEVVTAGGRRATGLDPVAHAVEMQREGAGELLLTAVDRDGTQQGYDIELIRKVSSAVNIPVIAAGGAGKLEDFAEAINAGASAVAAGAFLVFHGKHRAVLISYPTVADLEQALAGRVPRSAVRGGIMRGGG
ncbi:MAG: AglZ/HisF2 family acetamidino modification protein [Candidatus Geothermincolia bacterium]